MEDEVNYPQDMQEACSEALSEYNGIKPDFVEGWYQCWEWVARTLSVGPPEDEWRE